MKAFYFDGRCSLRERKRPSPEKNEALIRVLLAGICRTDLEIVKGYMNFTGILGHEFVGRVEHSQDKRWIGKRVVGEINIACGECSFCHKGRTNHCPNRSILGLYRKDGAFAEYLTLPLKNLHEVPLSIRDEEAVFTEPIAAAYRIMEQIDIKEEDRVLILGDGKLASLTAQILSTTPCSLLCAGKHQRKLSLISSLGIPTRMMKDIEEKNFDVVIEATGNPEGFQEAIKRVRPQGTIILKSTYHGSHESELMKIVIDEINIIGSRCGPFPPALDLLKEKKVIVSPLVSKIFSLDEASQAFQYATDSLAMKVLIQP